MGLSRLEAFSRLGRVFTAETMFAEAAVRANEATWRSRLTDTDYRGDRWWNSQRGSNFPGDDPRFCARKALYGMMGLPNEKPASRMLTGTAIVGSAVEAWNVVNLEYDGRLLAASEGTARTDHVGFVGADHWLTGSPDFVVLPKFWNRPHLIETKTKDAAVVVEMRNGLRSYDASHARQARGYLGMGNRISRLAWPDVVVCKHTWRIAEPGSEDVIDAMVCPDHGIGADSGCLIRIELEPMRTGSLYYAGRDRPGNVVVEYFFEHDEAWFQAGLRQLEKVRSYFEAGELPPHPFGGKGWSELPCKFCDHKKMTCKPDHKAGVSRLAESKGAQFAAEVYGSYDPEWALEEVLKRWRGRSGFTFSRPVQVEGRERV